MLNSSKMMSRNIMASLKAIRSNKFSMNLKKCSDLQRKPNKYKRHKKRHSDWKNGKMRNFSHLNFEL
jgi:hypothetical protein